MPVGMLAVDSFVGDDSDDDAGYDTPFISKEGEKSSKKRLVYNYYVLLLLLLAFISSQVNRLIINFMKDEIQADIGFNDSQYGFLVGYGFTVVFVLCGVPLGAMADKYSRKNLLIFGIVMWSTSTLAQGFSEAYWHLVVSRVGLGIGEASFSPAALALIADYFEPEKRALPDSIFMQGSYIGAGLASIMSAIFLSIDSLGWRWTFYIFGIAGCVLAVLIFVTLKEPHRTRVVQPVSSRPSPRLVQHTSYTYKQSLFYMVTIESAWRFCVASGLRMLSTFSMAAFMPSVLKATYPEFDSMINYWYGMMTILMGISASLSSGVATTFWMRRTKRAPAYIAAVGPLLAIPFLCVALLADKIIVDSEASALALAFAFLFVSFFLSELWPGPATLLLQSVLPQGMQGTGFGIYFATVMLIGGAGPEIVALLIEHFSEASAAYVLLGVIVAGYVLSGLGFLWASRTYEEDLLTREVFIVGGDMSDSLPRRRRNLLYTGIALLLLGTLAIILFTFFI